MNSFLYRIATEYYRHHSKDLNSFTFVFPNRRAGLFFQQYLSEITNIPLFSPEIITIDACFVQASELKLADKLSMLFKLYRIYKSIGKSEESFDSFAFWGEMLLADFNEVDKYRIDAKQLFRNITELKEIDGIFNVFSEKQIEAIRQFWQNFEPETKNKSKEHFLALWEILFPLYTRFREELRNEKTGYEGMISREIVDTLTAQKNIAWFDNRKFVFIGFNALNPCEKILMEELQKRNLADFYWDYEANELRDPDNPASLFYKENTLSFKSKYEIVAKTEKLENKHIELIEIPSAIGQAKQVYRILQNLYPETHEQSYLKTAVVLPDENLLMPVLYSIPENIGKINVTMGYPLKITPVFSFIDHIFELFKRKRIIDGTVRFYYLTVANILNHQLIALICGDSIPKISDEIVKKNLIYVDIKTLQQHELLNMIFNPDVNEKTLLPYLLDIIKKLYELWYKKKEKPSDYSLESDFLYQYYITLNRIGDILKSQTSDVEIQLDTLIRLIKQLTEGINIPFVGEPLEGLQIIGALETRGLDFENIIISSFNEGVYPKKNYANSFIPYHLRKGFNLPTYEHQGAITSYNFYRLIHQAKKIFLLYDSRIDNGNTGEVSRFYQQLKFHYKIDIKERKVVYDLIAESPDIISIVKENGVLDKLKLFLDSTDETMHLSASSINTYIKCPLQFYFTYIEKIQPADAPTENIENNVFGTIFHEVINLIYQPYVGKIVTTDDLNALIKNEGNINKLISKAFSFHHFKQPRESNIELTGNNLLIARIIKKYIQGVLEKDKLYTPFEYIDGEKKCFEDLPTRFGKVKIKGYIDRIDSKDGIIRILDYKTGSGKLEFHSWDNLFAHNQGNKKRSPHVLQTLLYGFLYKKEVNNKKIIMPGIIYTQQIFHDDFSMQIKHKLEKSSILVENYFDYEQEFIAGLTKCVEEIFDPKIPFFQTNVIEVCDYCDFKTICKR